MVGRHVLFRPELLKDALSGLETHEIVCLDDVDRIAGQRVWEEAIFHLYNRILDRGGLLLVSLADLPAEPGPVSG